MVRITPFASVLCAALFGTACLTASASEIPFRMVEGFIAIEGRLEARDETLNLLLDSGASVSVLSERTARRLRLRLGQRQAVRGVRSEAIARKLGNIPVHAEGKSLGEMTLAADMSAADALCGEVVDGLVGADFFRGRIVQIDFARRRICLLAEPPVVAEGLRLPLKIRNQVLCAPMSVNGCIPRWVRLDTGCNEPLHWVVPRRVGVQTGIGTSIGFVSEPENLAVVSVSLGLRTFPETEAVLHGRELFPGESGLLGTGLLSRFRSVTIDAPGRTLLLQTAKD